MSSDYPNLTALLGSHAQELASEWFRAQGRNLYQEFYLWYRDGSDQVVGRIAWPTIASDKPGPDWLLATNERISPAWTRERTAIWIRNKLGRLPILGTQ